MPMHALAENRGQPMTKISEVVKLKNEGQVYV